MDCYDVHSWSKRAVKLRLHMYLQKLTHSNKQAERMVTLAGGNKNGLSTHLSF